VVRRNRRRAVADDEQPTVNAEARAIAGERENAVLDLAKERVFGVHMAAPDGVVACRRGKRSNSKSAVAAAIVII
jgi:hypothetical protein